MAESRFCRELSSENFRTNQRCASSSLAMERNSSSCPAVSLMIAVYFPGWRRDPGFGPQGQQGRLRKVMMLYVLYVGGCILVSHVCMYICLTMSHCAPARRKRPRSYPAAREAIIVTLCWLWSSLLYMVHILVFCVCLRSIPDSQTVCHVSLEPTSKWF